MHKYLSEAAGTFLLVFIGTFAVTRAGGNTFIIALAFGCALFAVVMLFGAVSGAHVNPAVSLGAWIRGSLSSHDVLPYWIAQFSGAIAASVLLAQIVGPGQTLGETLLAPSFPPLFGFLLEALLSAIFVGVIFSCEQRSPRFAAFLIAGALFLAHLLAVPLTGASLNPARSLAPVVGGMRPEAAAELWVSVFGPLAGAATIALVWRGMPFVRRKVTT